MATERVHIEISKALSKALEILKNDYQGSSLTDIFLVVDKDNAELSIYDDEENLLSQRIIDAWISLKDKKVIIKQLKDVVLQFDKENKFNLLDTYKPFSVNVSDENFVVQEELLTIKEESTIQLDGDFLDKMDKDFNDFLDNLLKE